MVVTIREDDPPLIGRPPGIYSGGHPIYFDGWHIQSGGCDGINAGELPW